jgi:peptide deformylase
MPAQRIRQLGDPVLRSVSAPVGHPAEVVELLLDLRDTLHEFQRTHGFGRGISAVQIGDARRVIYIEIDGHVFSLINPEILGLSKETFEMWDDCFSFPNLMVRLRRHQALRVRFMDETGETRILQAEGPFSELLQHEIDHLDGVLAVDRALDKDSLATREEWLRSYRNSAK